MPRDEAGAPPNAEPQLLGAPCHKVIVFELCAGSARLSGALKRKGFRAMAVDHSRNGCKQFHQTISINLADPDSVTKVLSLIDDGILLYMHAAPPFGTASRTSERNISKKPRKRNMRARMELRSDQYPHGLPSLKFADRARVQLANKIYEHMCQILSVAARHCIITIEHPKRSYMWQTKWLKKLIHDRSLFPIHFQQCMFGGSKDFWVTFYTNEAQMSALVKTCDRHHTHFTSSSALKGKAAYTPELCDAIADIICKCASKRGVIFPAHSLAPVCKTNAPKIRAAQAGHQPRGNLLPQIIPELKYTIEISWPIGLALPSNEKRVLTTVEADTLQLPRGSKILPLERGSPKAKDMDHRQIRVGVYRSPGEFEQEACNLTHPFDGSSAVSDNAKRAIFFLLTEGRDKLREARESVFAHYERLADALADDEAAIHASMDPFRERLVRDKKLLLFKHMCKDAGIEDDFLVDLLVNGVKLTGVGALTSQFELDRKEPAMTEEQLMKSTRWTRRKVLGSNSSTPDAAVAKEVWEGTCDEVSRGWLSGPFSPSEVQKQLGPLFVASRRFGLV